MIQDHPKIYALAVGFDESLFVGTSEGLFRRGAGEAAWLNVSNGLNNHFITEIEPVDEHHLYLGTLDGFYKSHDKGNSWQPSINNVFARRCNSLASDSISVWAATDNAGIVRWKDGEWSESPTNRGYSSIQHVSYNPADASIYAAYAGLYDFIEHLLPTGIYIISQNDSNCYVDRPLNNIFITSIDNSIADPQFFLLATWEGIYKTTDRGETFYQPNGAPRLGFQSLCAHPNNPAIFYAGSEFYSQEAWHGVYKTENEGNIWEYISQPDQIMQISDLEISSIDPETIYASNDVHGLLKSTNAGQSWSYIKEELPGYFRYINAVESSPEHANWVFAGGVSCFWSQDAGKTWIGFPPLPKGSGEIRDLLIRPQEPNRLYVATAGRGIIAYTFSPSSVVKNLDPVRHFEINPSFPNPFNSETSISFELPTKQSVSVHILNVTGQVVWQRVETLPAGKHQIKWNGNDLSGSILPSGIYLIEIKTERYRAVKKITLTR